MNNKLRPAVVSGVVLFALIILTLLAQQVFPPYVVSLLGFCHCLWPLSAGVLATFLYIKKSPLPVEAAEGALLGALAGLTGGVLYLIIGTPIAYALTHTKMEAQMDQLRQAGLNIPESMVGFPLFLAAGLFSLIIYTVLATIGGLIAVPLFEKRKGGATAAPQNFGAPPPGTYGSGGSSGV